MNESAVKEGVSLESLVAQVADEFLARRKRGERVEAEEYAARYPEHAAPLREVLAALQLIDASAGGVTPEGLRDETVSGRLGDFQLLREVGRGGMGVVYEAEQISLGRRVALKVLPFAATMDPRQLQRFHNEARSVASLHHEHIVPIHAVGCERGVHFYAMQFINGLTLAELIGQHTSGDEPTTGLPVPLPDAETGPVAAARTSQAPRDAAYCRRVAEWGIQAAEALEHAHSLGIVHRDVKPGNLMIDAQGKLWVTDFGLARTVTDAGLTMTGDMLGTLRYMSPEQALVKHGLVDHRSDVYALGVTLYEVLTGRPAIEGTDRQEILSKIALEEPKPPRRLNKAVPAELETIVLKAMEKSPSDRYGTAHELAEDLRRWLEDRPIKARRPTLVQRLRKGARRHRVAVMAGAVCLLVVGAAVTGSIGWVLGEQRARQRDAEIRVHEALEEAAPPLRQGNPRNPELVAALQRVKGQLDAAAVGPELHRRVEQLLLDWEMLGRLETARLQRAVGDRETGFDYAGADELYAQAFKGYDLDVTALNPAGAAQRIRSSAICTPLVAALDDWTFLRNSLDRDGGASLRALADLADDDLWRQGLRRAMSLDARAVFEQLAEAKGILEQPSANLMLLAFALSHSRSDETAERLLRRAQAKFPADFWMNFDLANFLLHKKTPDFSEALRYMQAAVALDPHSPVAQNSLGVALGQKGRLEEAIACFVEAIRLKSDYPDAHVSLGVALANKDRLDEAIAKYHDAIRLKKNSPAAYYNLGNALRQKRKPDEAIAAYRETIRLKKDYPGAYINLGVVLGENRRPDEAITEFHKAIEIQPDAHNAYTCLGAALEQKGDLEGAIAAYRQSIRIKEDNPVARINLSVLLAKRGDVDEAITIVREGLRLNPESVDLHDGLGFALRAKGDFDGAIAAFHEAIRLNNKYAGASTNGYTHLGHVLKAKGQFADALASYRRSHELTKAPQWRLQLAKWVKECEHLVELDGKLPRVLEGVLVPGDAAESAEFAAICCTPVKQRYAAAVRFYRDAFAKQPGLADDVQQQHRYNAACAAALAGCGQGKDAAQITEPQRVLWRQQALEWLQSDLEARTALLQKTPQLRDAVQEQLLYWQKDSDLAGVREPAALAKLPQAEQSRWSELWKRVADKRRDLAPPGNPKK